MGQGEAELFLAVAGQSPALNDLNEFRARVRLVDLPHPLWDGTWLVAEETVVISIGFDPADGELSQEAAAAIIGSLTFPECSVNYVVVEREAVANADINGDGHIATVDDYQKLLGFGG